MSQKHPRGTVCMSSQRIFLYARGQSRQITLGESRGLTDFRVPKEEWTISPDHEPHLVQDPALASCTRSDTPRTIAILSPLPSKDPLTMLLSFIRKLFRRVSRHHSTTLRFRPGLESLDTRTLPSTTGLGAVPTPAINGSAEAITAIASNDIWAVGSFIPAGSNTTQPLAEHFNGTSWSVVPTPANANGQLLAVSAVASNNVWAVGNNGSTNTALIEHWNGTSWSIVPAPAQPGSGWLNSVTAISANDVWAVGFAAGHNLIEHFNGTSWSVVSAPARAIPISSASRGLPV